ncbi:nucleotidyltransferase domain-containing protein [Streptomyces sp. NPDC054775]
MWLFGSFARGATKPHDVDVAVRFERDERMNQAVVQAIFSGGNPYAPLRRALAGSSRGLQFQFEDGAREQLEAEGTFMLPLWQRGDSLTEALGVLHAIAEDPEAGRAERHDMTDAFEGLDRHIPRPIRAELIGWQQQEAITIFRIKLSDAPDDTDLLATPDMRWGLGACIELRSLGGPGEVFDPDH